MTHLRIEQNNIQENVSSAVIEKLYGLAISGDLDSSSNLAGNLHTTATYLEYIDAIHTAYPDLYISANNIYIMFEDLLVDNVLKSAIGDGVGVTTTLLANANFGSSTLARIFKKNTTITSFNELSLSNTTSLQYDAFQLCSNLVSIDLSNITTVDNNAFLKCSNLQSIGNSSNITSVGANAFQQCSKLKSFSWNQLTSIGNSAFSGASLEDTPNVICTNLTSLGRSAFSNSKITSFTAQLLLGTSDYTFENCTSLTTINILNITSTGTATFKNCTALTTISGLSNVTSLTELCFSGCSSLTSIDIDWSKLTSISGNVFNGCSSLSSAITIQNTVTYIGDKAFYNCRNIPSITFQTGGSNALTIYGSSGGGPFRGTYSVNKIIFPENLSSLASGALNIANDETKVFVFTSTTPPSVSDNGLAANAMGVNQNGHTIYVPDSSVTAYQNALGSNLSGKIYPVSQMPT